MFVLLSEKNSIRNFGYDLKYLSLIYQFDYLSIIILLTNLFYIKSI